MKNYVKKLLTIGLCITISVIFCGCEIKSRYSKIEGTYFEVGTENYLTFSISDVSRGDYGGTAKAPSERLKNWYVEKDKIFINEEEYFIIDSFLVQNKLCESDSPVPDKNTFDLECHISTSNTGNINSICFKNDGTGMHKQEKTEEYKQLVTSEYKDYPEYISDIIETKYYDDFTYSVEDNIIKLTYKNYTTTSPNAFFIYENKLYGGKIYRK